MKILSKTLHVLATALALIAIIYLATADNNPNRWYVLTLMWNGVSAFLFTYILINKFEDK